MKNKKILLVGGCGFIGHNLALHLKNLGNNPIVVDSLSVNNILSFTDSEIKNRKLYWSILNQRMDLLHQNDIQINIEDARNYNAMSMLLSKEKPDVIIQLAAVSHANKSNKDPHSTFDHSLRTLENTLDFARINKTHLIYMSSSMVYGNFDGKDVSDYNELGIVQEFDRNNSIMASSSANVVMPNETCISPEYFSAISFNNAI